MDSLKILIKIGFTAMLAFLFQTMMPWWSVGVAAFLISLIISTNRRRSFMSGFLGVGLLWLFQSWLIHLGTDGILSDKVAVIFSLTAGWQLVFVTAMVGGLAGGFCALTGSTLRNWIIPTDQ